MDWPWAARPPPRSGVGATPAGGASQGLLRASREGGEGEEAKGLAGSHLFPTCTMARQPLEGLFLG